MSKIGKSKSLSALNNPEFLGSKDYDPLLPKNKTVKFLEKATKEWVDKDIYSYFTSFVLRDYTKSFYNKSLALVKYLKINGTTDKYLNDISLNAKNIWYNTPLNKLIYTRFVAHISANCSYNMDFTVYRGIKFDKQATTDAEIIVEMEGLKNDIMLLENITEEKFNELIKTKDKFSKDNRKLVRTYIKMKEKLENKFIYADMSKLNSRGEIIKSDLFMSTSLSVNHARRFIRENCCLMKIEIPAGAPCIYVSNYSSYTGTNSEYEVVLPPCAELVFIKRDDSGVFHMRYNGITPDEQKSLSIESADQKVLIDAANNGTNSENLNKLLHNPLFFSFCKSQIKYKNY